MTDLLSAAPTVEELLFPPPDHHVQSRVRRFGVEYEMFARGRRDYDDDDGFGDDDDGFGDDEIRDYVARAAGDGLCNSDKHSYHCDCSECDYERSWPLMATQNDCTVGVEMVSRILNVEDDEDLAELDKWVEHNERWARSGGWMPDGIETCGNHIHVERATERQLAPIVLAYAAFDWEAVADGGCGRMRGYNTKPRVDGTGTWACVKPGTIEHRLWNTPREPKRLWTHVGLSVALTRWGLDCALHGDMRQIATGDIGYGYPRPTRSAVDLLAANRDRFVEQVLAYLPSSPAFSCAADVLDAGLKTY